MASRLAFEAPPASNPALMPGTGGVKRAPRTPLGGTAFGVPATAQTVTPEDLWAPEPQPSLPPRSMETTGGNAPMPASAPAPVYLNPNHPELGTVPPPIAPPTPEPQLPGMPVPPEPGQTPGIAPANVSPRRVPLESGTANLIQFPPAYPDEGTGAPAPPPPVITPTPTPPITTPTGIDENTGATIPTAPTGTPTTPAPAQNFGDLSNPASWMALVNNPAQLTAWIKANNPGWSDSLVQYYAGVIKGQPGANATEQAGSAQYYLGKFQQDPFYGGSGGEGGSGNYNVGGDALSGSITDALMQLLQGGGTPYQAEAWKRIMDLLDNGGQTPAIKGRLIGAREDAARAQQSLMADASGALADRGLISTPGVAQGGEVGALERITENVGKDYAGAVRDIENNALDQSNASFMSALQMATGMSQNQASTLLSAIGAGTNRQTALAGIALQSLSLNQDWNKFLATNSLDQARLMFDIQNGKISTLVPLLQQFISYLQTLNQGAI